MLLKVYNVYLHGREIVHGGLKGVSPSAPAALLGGANMRT